MTTRPAKASPPVLLIDADGIVVEANGPARELLGVCVGRRCPDLVQMRTDHMTLCAQDCPQQLVSSGGHRETAATVRTQPQQVRCTSLRDHAVVQILPHKGPVGWEEPLTPREMQVLELVSKGLTNARIGRRLGISVSTVRTHVEHIRDKLGANTRAEAVARAMSVGWLTTAL